MCMGCIIDEERTHTCKTLSLEDIFERYFTTAWVGLNEDDVIGRLRCLVCADPVLLNTSWFDLCQYQCKNYLHVNLKTVEWMDILKEQVVWKIVCVYKVTSENSLELSVRKWHPKWNLMLKMSVTKTDLKNIQTRVVLYSIVQRGLELLVKLHEGRKEGNVLFNDALNTFYCYGYMVKDHSDSEKGNPLPPHRLLFPISSKGSFICTIPQTG